MAKTRLNAQSRRDLLSYAASNIECPAERKELETTYNKAADLVQRDCLKAFPLADMEVLEKYGAADLGHCVRGTHRPVEGETTVIGFEYRLGALKTEALEYNSVGETKLRIFFEGTTDCRWKVLNKSGSAKQREMIAETEGDPRIPISPSRAYREHDLYVKFKSDTAEAVAAYDRAVAAYEKAMMAKFSAYKQLVIGSRYIDDVLEVWPNAHGVVKDIASTGHALTISREALAVIASDNAGSA